MKTMSKETNKAATIDYWIWVKDGEIGYWSYPNEKSIPRYIQPLSSQQTDKWFIPTEELQKYYGRPEQYTPFAADDVLSVKNVVKEPFSASARALLSIF